MGHPPKPVLLNLCRHCGRELAVDGLRAPNLGLVRLVCERCHHEHLYSPQELEIAQVQHLRMEKPSPAGFPRLLHSLRRVLSA